MNPSPPPPCAFDASPPGLHGFAPLRGKTPDKVVRVFARRSGDHSEPTFTSAMASPLSSPRQLWRSPPKDAAQHLKRRPSPFKAVSSTLSIPHRHLRRACASPRSSDDTESCATSQGDHDATHDEAPRLPHAQQVCSQDDLAFLMAGLEEGEVPLLAFMV